MIWIRTLTRTPQHCLRGEVFLLGDFAEAAKNKWRTSCLPIRGRVRSLLVVLVLKSFRVGEVLLLPEQHNNSKKRES